MQQIKIIQVSEFEEALWKLSQTSCAIEFRPKKSQHFLSTNVNIVNVLFDKVGTYQPYEGEIEMKKSDFSALYAMVGSFVTYWIFCFAIIAQNAAHW